MFLKNRNIISKIKRSKVTDYAAISSIKETNCIESLIFVYGNPKMGTFTNSVDPDEMPHNVAFHQGLHCKGIKTFRHQNTICFKVIT